MKVSAGLLQSLLTTKTHHCRQGVLCLHHLVFKIFRHNEIVNQGNLIGKIICQYIIYLIITNFRRCPMPTTNVTTKKNSPPTLLTDIDIERMLQSSSSTEIPSSTSQPISTKTIPMKSFVRRREPESGKKINVFNIDDEEITIDGADNPIEVIN